MKGSYTRAQVKEVKIIKRDGVEIKREEKLTYLGSIMVGKNDMGK